MGRRPHPDTLSPADRDRLTRYEERLAEERATDFETGDYDPH